MRHQMNNKAKAQTITLFLIFIVTLAVLAFTVAEENKEQTKEEFEQDENIPQHIRTELTENPEFGTKITTTKTDGKTTINYGEGHGVEIHLTEQLGTGLGGFDRFGTDFGTDLGGDDKIALGPGSSITMQGEEITEAIINVPGCLGDEVCRPGPKEYKLNGITYKVEQGSTLEFKKGENGEQDKVTITTPKGTAVHKPLGNSESNFEVEYKIKDNEEGTIPYSEGKNKYNIGLGKDESFKFSSKTGLLSTENDVEIEGASIITRGKETNLLFGDDKKGELGAAYFNKETKEIKSIGGKEGIGPAVILEGLGEENDYDIPMKDPKQRMILVAFADSEVKIKGKKEIAQIETNGRGTTLNGNTLLYVDKNGKVVKSDASLWDNKAESTKNFMNILGIPDKDTKDLTSSEIPTFFMFNKNDGTPSEDYEMNENGEIFPKDSGQRESNVNAMIEKIKKNEEDNKRLNELKQKPEFLKLDEDTKSKLEKLYKENPEAAEAWISKSKGSRPSLGPPPFSSYSGGQKYMLKDDPSTFKQTLASLNEKDPKKRLVVFTADNCAPCQSLKNQAIPQLEKQGYEVIFLNSKSYSNGEFNQIKSNIGATGGYPAIMVSNPDGTFTHAGNGNKPASTLINALQ